MQIDVLVVGAGPVGLAMASELARYGLSVRVVDKNTERTDKSKAIVIWSRTLELMDRMGCAGQFVSAGLPITDAYIIAGNKPIGHVSTTQLQSPYAFALDLPQSDTERLLEEHLKTYGLSVERNAELTEFDASAEKVSSSVHYGDGHNEIIESRWLIGCDGSHSTARHQLGMEFQGEKLLADWILADVHLQGITGPPAIDIIWHSDGILAIFPLSGTRYRIIANSGESTGAEPAVRPAPTLEEIQKILDVRGVGGITASDAVWMSCFSINERMVCDYRAGRVFLAGDAAHIHSPAGGQGMNTGIQDACNLAWKLALVAKGTCVEEPLLGSYSTERSAVAKLLLEVTGRATTIAIMKKGILQDIRNHVVALLFDLDPVPRTAATLLSELAVRYHHSPLTADHLHSNGGPAAGDRAPIREHESPVGAGNTPRFVLFAEPCGDAATVVAQFPNLLETQVRAPYDEGGLWLVRPDGYVGLSTKSDDWERARAYLASLATKG